MIVMMPTCSPTYGADKAGRPTIIATAAATAAAKALNAIDGISTTIAWEPGECTLTVAHRNGGRGTLRAVVSWSYLVVQCDDLPRKLEDRALAAIAVPAAEMALLPHNPGVWRDCGTIPTEDLAATPKIVTSRE